MSNAPTSEKNSILELAEMFAVLTEEIGKQIPPWNFLSTVIITSMGIIGMFF